MFGKSTEKRVVREADKIASMKEDMDALSWGRVLEIARLLQESSGDGAGVDLANELALIAQSNLSLNARLGIERAQASPRIMPSGIEVLEGGLADAAIKNQENAVGFALAFEEPDPDLEELEMEELEVAKLEVESVRPDFSEEDHVSQQPQLTSSEQSESTSPEQSEPANPGQFEQSESANPGQFEPTGPDPTVSADVLTPSDSGDSEELSGASHRQRFARFRNLYESRDGGLFVFEDEHGHLVAVDASKLA